jgi:RimJ/RimL family protein N-acetyltransferase
VPRGEIGYWLATNQTKNGYAIEAVNALTTNAWVLGLARVEIRCDVLNGRSRSVAERASYPLEGILKNECRNPQRALRDTCVYARMAANDAMRRKRTRVDQPALRSQPLRVRSTPAGSSTSMT